MRLHGRLDRKQAAWFSELACTEDPHGNMLIAGELLDQSALLGILFRAHNLNLQILSVDVKVNENAKND
jgi:hypothetical protein